MCGIVGYVTSKPSVRYSNFIQQGLFVDSLRGACGTGIYAADLKEHRGFTYKRALIGPDFLQSKQAEMFNRRIDKYQVVIGHNRASTIGDARDEHCHPFVYNHIGFVHNGTLRDYRDLVKDKQFMHNVDSAWAAKAMSEVQDPVDVLSKVQGPYVFVWHDMDKMTFNIARNNNRDIWFVLDKDSDALFFASEVGMLQWLLGRNGVDIGNNKFRSPKEHTLVQWDLTKPFTKAPRIVAYEEYNPPKYHAGYAGSGYNWRDKQLAEVELEYNEEVLAEVSEWKPYDNYQTVSETTRGTLYGKIHAPRTKADGLECVFHGLMQKECAPLIEAKFVVGKTVTVNSDFVKYDQKEQKSLYKYKVTLNTPTISKNHGPSDLSKKVVIVEDKKTEETTPKEGSKSTDVIVAELVVAGPEGTFLTPDEFREETKTGCVYCGDPLDIRLASEIEWVEWGQGTGWLPLCLACQRTPEVRSELINWGVEISKEPKRAGRH